MSIAHSPTFPSLHLRHSSFSNLYFAPPTSQALHLRHLVSCPWCKQRMRYQRPSKWHLWAELILQTFSHFTYVTAHSDSPSFLSLHLCHSSFSNSSLVLPTSQLILQPFHCFTYITAHSPTLLLPPLHHRIFTYVTWWAAHGLNSINKDMK